MAVGLRTPQNSAEDLKRKYGCALTTLVNENETIEVPGVGGRKARTVLRRNLCEVIEPRAEETLNLINNEVHRSGLLNRLGSGVVLTGGASQLDGLTEMGEFLFDVPVRRGGPVDIGGLTDVVKSPAFAVAVGLLVYAVRTNQYLDRGTEPALMKEQSFEENVNQTVSNWFHKVKNIFGESEL